MSTKIHDGHVRISEQEKTILKNLEVGFTRVFRIGLDTLKVWIHQDTPHPCVYLYNTGQNRAPPAAALCPTSKPPAQGCPCPACPIRSAFAGRAACGEKENVPAGPDPSHEMQSHPGESAEDSPESVTG